MEINVKYIIVCVHLNGGRRFFFKVDVILMSADVFIEGLGFVFSEFLNWSQINWVRHIDRLCDVSGQVIKIKESNNKLKYFDFKNENSMIFRQSSNKWSTKMREFVILRGNLKIIC